MRKLLLTLTAIAGLTVAVNAQDFGFKKGDVLVEGSINVESENDKNDDDKHNEFSISPKAGYFLTDKFALGLALDFYNHKDENSNSGYEEKDSRFGVGVFGRYYFLELGKRFKTYAEVNAQYLTGEEEYRANSAATVNTAEYNGFALNGGLGANYFVTERIAINVALSNIIGYNSQKYDGA
ncbi:porin family protein, partial [Pseudoxanthomonas sp. SGD-10]